ncbi:serine/threonine-protein kinase PknK [Vitiosangium sp. GDMCC 1.1324]|uniref:serine/threonine-protein kinase n=1 Tax=Vitiosangium sp. (strain GDMCC 1.1324) TaxID=2138576 RepID=UPI0026C36C92
MERMVARGGFGSLLSARRLRDGQRVAIKLAHHRGAPAEQALCQEAEALRTIGPPTVPEVYETGRVALGSPYLVMQFIHHPLLAELLARREGASLSEGSRRALALVEALETVHHRGLIHCDLKPENIFVDEAAGAVGFFDFGLARPLVIVEDETPSTRVGAYAGTAEYMAPEQCLGAALDARTDIYAVGVLLYEMLTGRTPFFGPTADVHRAHLTRRPPRPSELGAVPPALEEVVLRCLAKERSRRYASARELSLALRRALEQPSGAPARQRTAPPGPSAVSSCSAAVLFLRSGANPVTVQKALALCGGQLAFQKGTCFAAVFDSGAEAHPLQGARQCAERMLSTGLAVTLLVDVARVKVLRGANGSPRYLSPIFSLLEHYPTEHDPRILLLTEAAVMTLPHLAFVPVPGRPGLFREASPEAGEDTPIMLWLEHGMLLGRQRELEALVRSACSAVWQQAPTLATVRGDRGLGKSHLAAALLHHLRQRLPGARVLSLRARAPVQGDSEGTLRLLLRQVLGGGGTMPEEAAYRARCEELLGVGLVHELWPVVASCLGWLTSTPGLSSQAAAPGALRALVVRTVGELLAASARAHPLLLLLDDAHFVEEVTLEALEYAARAESRIPLWVCVLSRPGFKRAHPQWGSRAAHHHSLKLGPLALPDAMELCRAELRPAESVPAEALARLAERAQRVPLFLVELARGLKRQGMVRQRSSGGWYLATDELERVPEIHLVEWLAQHELAALPAELTAHTLLCALLGSDFDLEEVEGVVEELAREDGASDFPLEPRHATHRLVELGLLVAHPREGLRFRNELLREAVTRSLSEAWRWRIHRAAHQYHLREACTRGRPRQPRLAFHAAACGLRGESSALYMELAESARARHAYLEAEATYTRVLELLPDMADLWCLAALRGRGLMRYRVGRYEDSLADLERARELARHLGNTREELEVLLDEATALDWTNDYARSAERVEQARSLAVAARLDTPLSQVRVLLGMGRVRFRQGRWEQARVLLEAASAQGGLLGDAGYESRIISLLLLGFILPNLGRIGDAQRVLEECIAACSARGDTLHLGSAINNRRNLWVARGELARALEDQEHFKRLGRELGMVGWEYFAEHNMGELHYQMGDLEAAEPHIARAVEVERNHPEVAPRPWGLLLRARALAYAGQEEQARQALQAIRQALAERPGTELNPSESVLFSLVEMATRPTSPEEWQALRVRSDACSVEQEPLEVLELQALARLRRGERQVAVVLLEEALRRAEHIPTIMRPRLLNSLRRA